MNKLLLILVAILFATAGAFAQETTVKKGEFTDPRDNRVYQTITFGDFLLGETTWMAENLDYKTSNSWAYDNNEAYRPKLGLLYTWDAAKSACPDGWHLPSDTEWDLLVNNFGGADKAGIALKHSQGWKPHDEYTGTNTSGFNALPGGHRNADGTFSRAGEYGYWWSSSPSGSERAWERYLRYDNGKVDRFNSHREDGFSVRCVKD